MRKMKQYASEKLGILSINNIQIYTYTLSTKYQNNHWTEYLIKIKKSIRVNNLVQGNPALH